VKIPLPVAGRMDGSPREKRESSLTKNFCDEQIQKPRPAVQHIATPKLHDDALLTLTEKICVIVI
jgi:hypothetical protein